MLFSIIIPAYNVEKYIDDCLTSVFRQDLNSTDFEVIVVDDCSSDKTIDIIKTYEIRHKNLKFIQHNVNKRQGGARNSALKVAEGDYVIFLDADDCWLFKNTLTIFSHFLIDKNLTILESAVHEDLAYDYKLRQSFFVDELNLEVVSNVEFLTSNKFSSYIWRSVYRRNFLLDNNMYFLENIMFEDADWRDRSLYLCTGDIGLIEFPFYGYRANPNSTCRKPNKEMFLANIEANIRITNLLYKYKNLPSSVVSARLNRIKRNVFSFVKISRNYKVSESVECFQQLNHSILMQFSNYHLSKNELLKMIIIKYFSLPLILSIRFLTLFKRFLLRWKN